MPPSPRQQRHMSLSQAQIQDLLNNPPTAGQADPKFAGRDWQHITVGELVDPEDLRFVELDTGVEEATNVCTTRPKKNLKENRLLVWNGSSPFVISFSQSRAPPFSLFAPLHRKDPQWQPSTIGT